MAKIQESESWPGGAVTYLRVRSRARDRTTAQLGELVEALDAEPILSRWQSSELRALRAELRNRAARGRQ